MGLSEYGFKECMGLGEYGFKECMGLRSVWV